MLSCLLVFLLVHDELPGLGDQQQGQGHQQQHRDEAEGQGQEVHQGLGCLLHSDKSGSLGIDLRNYGVDR